MPEQKSKHVGAAAEFVRTHTKIRPLIGVVLGSGLGGLVAALGDREELPYREIPGMPETTVAGHGGYLVIGHLERAPVACLSGRVHLYEGRSVEDVVFGARVLAALGCRAVLLTNAAGSLDPTLVPGALMLISDHINLTGHNPLIGYRSPPRFLDLTNAYDLEFRVAAREVLKELDEQVHEGIYVGLTGPSYETPAEVGYLARIGGKAVGMSTVLEAIALRDLSVRLGGVCCITNAAAGVEGSILDHGHVQEVAREAHQRFGRFVKGWIARICQVLPLGG